MKVPAFRFKTILDIGRLAKALILWVMLLAGLILVSKHSNAFGELPETLANSSNL